MTGATGSDRVSWQVLTVVLVVLLSSPGLAVGLGSGAAATSGSVDASVVVASQQTQNNSTVQHEHPDTVNEQGDADQLESWLSSQLAARLEASSANLSQGEYDLARQHVDEEYRDLLRKYVDVTGETEESENRTKNFEAAQREQQGLVSNAEKYNRTLEEYHEAKEEGNTSRARELARELERLAGNVSESRRNLQNSTGQITNETGADLSTIENVSRTVEENVSNQQREIRESEFVETNLDVQAENQAGSFLDPFTFSGTLRTENGTALANRTITLEVGNQIATTPTDDTGNFSITYRPTTVPLNVSEIPIEYLPDGDSVYLSSTASAPVNISQVTPDVRIENSPREVGVSERITVEGTVSADDTGANAVPVVIFLADQRLGTTRTNETGAFTRAVTVPVSIDAGSQQIRAAVTHENRALAAANSSVEVTVAETPTELSLAINEEESDDHLRNVTGQLVTSEGEPIAKQPVEIRVDGATLQTLRTDADGQYAGTVDLSEAVSSTQTEADVTVTAVYRGQDTALEEARASASVTLVNEVATGQPSLLEQVRLWATSVPPLAVLAGGVGTLGLGFLLFRRQSGNSSPVGKSDAMEPTDASAARNIDDPSQPDHTEAAIAVASDQLSRGNPERAVSIIYAATRQRIDSSLDLDPGQTHWEVYTACQASDLPKGRLDAVREVVTAFEQATFTQAETPRSTAEAALDALEQLDDRKTDSV